MSTTVPKSGYNSKESGGSGGGTDIYIDLTSTTVQGENVGTNTIGIGHEEGHAFRFDQGLVEDSYVNDSSKSDAQNFMDSMVHISRIKKTEETETTHIENIIRAQIDPSGNRIPLRQTYDNLKQYRITPFSKKPQIYYENIKTIKPGYDYYKTPKN